MYPEAIRKILNAKDAETLRRKDLYPLRLRNFALLAFSMTEI